MSEGSVGDLMCVGAVAYQLLWLHYIHLLLLMQAYSMLDTRSPGSHSGLAAMLVVIPPLSLLSLCLCALAAHPPQQG